MATRAHMRIRPMPMRPRPPAHTASTHAPNREHPPHKRQHVPQGAVVKVSQANEIIAATQERIVTITGSVRPFSESALLDGCQHLALACVGLAR